MTKLLQKNFAQVQKTCTEK